MPNPHGFTPFMVTYARDEDLPAVVDIIAPLRVVGSFSISHLPLPTSPLH
jgi:hypothetical protein